jgi:hypothetical protein
MVLKISFLCDATFCPSLRGFLLCPEDGSIVCPKRRIWESEKVKFMNLIPGASDYFLVQCEVLTLKPYV